MKNHEAGYPVKKMAETLKISRSRYYAWLKSKPSYHKLRDEELLEKIKLIHEDSRETYGSPNVFKAIEKKGIKTSKKRVARLMRENGLKGAQKRRFKVTTDSRHDYPIAPNLLNRQFDAKKPNSCWVGDITYIWTQEGWLYLSVIIDLFSRMVVGWAMESHMRAELVIDSLKMAVTNRKPGDGVMFHSDRGIQYACDDFRTTLNGYKMIQSMSRKGNCWDNACAESFFATLKTEEVYRRKYQTREEARLCIFEYIAVFYNRYRQHYFLDFLSPEEYEKSMLQIRKPA
jgi:transposase InsO family protein